MNAYTALNIELRHLCQRQNAGDRWRNSIFKQVVRAMSVPRNDLFFCNLLRWTTPIFFPQHQAAFGKSEMVGLWYVNLFIFIVEGSLEVKLPTIWTVEKQR